MFVRRRRIKVDLPPPPPSVAPPDLLIARAELRPPRPGRVLVPRLLAPSSVAPPDPLFARAELRPPRPGRAALGRLLATAPATPGPFDVLLARAELRPARAGRVLVPRLLAAASVAPTLALDLLDAASAWLAADAGLAALAPGGVWDDEAPIGTPLPYLVISEPSADSNNESGVASIEPVGLQLAIYAEGKAPARAVRRYAAAVVNDAPLVFSAGTLLHLRVANRTSAKDPDRGPGGGDVWQEVLMLEAVVGHG